MTRVTVVPIKRDPFLSMHMGRTKVHLLVQRQRPLGKDVGAILERNGRKSFVGFYHETQLAEIITHARKKVFCSFGDAFLRVDAGDASFIVHRPKDQANFTVRKAGKDVGRGKVAAKTSFLDTHDPKLVAIAPEVLLVMVFQGLEG
jgi:hypothetical protein